MGVRTVVVTPPSASAETAQVVQNLVLIAVVALLVSGVGRTGGPAAAALATYQVRFQAQGPDAQRVYRELAAALEEIVRTRDATGKWPTVEALAAEAIEPFEGAPRHRGDTPHPGWELHAEQGVVNYLGRDPRDLTGPYYLLCIQEPPPGTTGREGHLGGLDETHRKLADGTAVHVGLWFHARPRPGKDALDAPQREGWTQIVDGAPARPDASPAGDQR